MDHGSSQHIKLISKQKYFDKNMNKFFKYYQKNVKIIFARKY